MSASPSGPPSKHHGQVQLVLNAFGAGDPSHSVAIAPDDWQDVGVDHLHRGHSILVRDEDLGRVQALVGGVPADNLIDGVTRLEVADEAVRDVLDRIDSAHGVGVATPDHVLYTTTVTLCPAIEPEEITETQPFPAPAVDRSLGAGVRVSVVDTGFLPDAAAQHTWLAGVQGDPEDAYDGAGRIRPYAGHGTFVAGVVRTMAPAADVTVERVLTRAGAVFESDLVRALDAALDSSPDIISLSAGTTTRNNLPLLALEVFWRRRLSHYKGVALVAAAGNDGDYRPFWPAAFPWAVSVGAMGTDGRRADFTNRGGWVDVYAPGEGLVNAYATGTYQCQEPPNTGQERTFAGMCRWSGTSFSAPVVAGLLAGRMSRTFENGQQAAAALLALARENGRSGVGAVLEP